MMAGKTMLITAAAGSGIGGALAQRAAEEGATLMLSDMHERRLGETADIASAAVFLASDAASWITGHTRVVDGGAMIAPSVPAEDH